MAYLVTKKVKGHYYAYLQESYREGGSPRTRTVEYLGAIEPAIAKQITTVKQQANKVQMEALVESIKSQTSTVIAKSEKIEKETLSKESEPKTAQLKVNDSPVLVDTATGELLKKYDNKVITTESEPSRPFSESLKLPDTLEEYGISQTALLCTHDRYGKRLKELQINPSHMTDVSIAYGHPDRLERTKHGYTVFVSRRTQNVKHKANKARLWKHYRQALSQSYLDAIEQANPEQFNELETSLDYYHKDAKRLLFDCIKYMSSPTARIGLSLQLILWDKIPLSLRQKKTKKQSKKAQFVNPEEFGQIDFNTTNDWRSELVSVLSEVQKSGWQGVGERQKKARQKIKSTITKKRNELKGKSLMNRLSQKLSGKRRRLIREIMAKEAQLRTIDNLDDRIKTIKRVLPF